MRGHIARKGARYYAVVYEGTDPATGKERHRWYPGGATRREAEKVLGELVAAIVPGFRRRLRSAAAALSGSRHSIRRVAANCCAYPSNPDPGTPTAQRSKGRRRLLRLPFKR